MPCLLVCPAEPVPRYGGNEAFDQVLIAASLASARPWLSFARRRTWLAGASVIVQGLIAAAPLAAARQWPCCQLTRLTAHCAVRLADDCASLPACQPASLPAGRRALFPPMSSRPAGIHAHCPVRRSARISYRFTQWTPSWETPHKNRFLPPSTTWRGSQRRPSAMNTSAANCSPWLAPKTGM